MMHHHKLHAYCIVHRDCSVLEFDGGGECCSHGWMDTVAGTLDPHLYRYGSHGSDPHISTCIALTEVTPTSLQVAPTGVTPTSLQVAPTGVTPTSLHVWFLRE